MTGIACSRVGARTAVNEGASLAGAEPSSCAQRLTRKAVTGFRLREGNVKLQTMFVYLRGWHAAQRSGLRWTGSHSRVRTPVLTQQHALPNSVRASAARCAAACQQAQTRVCRLTRSWPYAAAVPAMLCMGRGTSAGGLRSASAGMATNNAHTATCATVMLPPSAPSGTSRLQQRPQRLAKRVAAKIPEAQALFCPGGGGVRSRRCVEPSGVEPSRGEAQMSSAVASRPAACTRSTPLAY